MRTKAVARLVPGEGHACRDDRVVAAGAVSGTLGIGGGILKVPILNAFCGVPMRAAAATSALMIGVTAVSSVPTYYAPVTSIRPSPPPRCWGCCSAPARDSGSAAAPAPSG